MEIVKKNIVWIGVGIGVVALVSAAVVFQTKGTASLPCTESEAGGLLDQATTTFLPSDKVKMMEFYQVADNIRNTKWFEDDINCVYPVMMSYLYQTDPASAQPYFTTYQQLQAEGQTVSAKYAFRFTNKDIQTQIDFLIKAATRAEQNSMGLQW